MAVTKGSNMDPKFADRMSDLSEISDETLEQRWSTLTTIVGAATKHHQARLVMIACGEPLDRDSDTWFWEPFRENEKTIPVDDGAALFTRFAECAVRYLIEVEENDLPAMLLRLAVNTGRKPFHQDLVDAGVARLEETDVTIPKFSAPATFWTKSMQTELTNNPADPGITSGNLSSFATNGQIAMTAVAKQVIALTNWAADAERRFSREQQLIRWLLNGVREDGKAWPSLSPGAVAIDAATGPPPDDAGPSARCLSDRGQPDQDGSEGPRKRLRCSRRQRFGCPYSHHLSPRELEADT
jgi:hypothetical protein